MRYKLIVFCGILSLCILFSACHSTMQQEIIEPSNKSALVVATVGISGREIAEIVENYNSQNSDYIVAICNYKTYSELFSALNTENGPDMFFLDSSSMSEARLSEYCINLKSLLDADKNFGAEDFISGLCDGFRESDMLWLPYDFTMLGFVAQPAINTGRSSFTLDVAQQIATDQGMLIFPAIWTRDMLLGWLSPHLAAAYMDWDNEVCMFDSPDFIALIEALKEHPEDFSSIPDEQLSLLNYFSINKGLNMFASVEYVEKTEGIDYDFFGLPSSVTSGGIFKVEQCFGIFSTSNNADAAWHFLRNFMSENIQSKSENIPAIQSSFEALIDEAVLNSKITPSSADKLLTFVNETVCTKDDTNNLHYVIQFEVNAFFEGTCTAQEASERIQQQANYILAEYNSIS